MTRYSINGKYIDDDVVLVGGVERLWRHLTASTKSMSP